MGRDQDDHDALYCVVDLHAMTEPFDPAELGEATRATATALLAAGLDPARCILFAQSHVAAHSELTWILNCVATYGELRRMTQFKEKGQGQESVSVGLFDYPVLMAADILLYDTDEVPVGDDQRQHLELTRDVAIRFNHRFGDTFVVPKATVPPVAARVMDLQNPANKMSKSVESPQGTVLVLDPPEVVAKKVKSAVTDSGTDVRYDPGGKPGVSNLLEIYAAATEIDDRQGRSGVRRRGVRRVQGRGRRRAGRAPGSRARAVRDARRRPGRGRSRSSAWVPTRRGHWRIRCSSAPGAPPGCCRPPASPPLGPSGRSCAPVCARSLAQAYRRPREPRHGRGDPRSGQRSRWWCAAAHTRRLVTRRRPRGSISAPMLVVAEVAAEPTGSTAGSRAAPRRRRWRAHGPTTPSDGVELADVVEQRHRDPARRRRPVPRSSRSTWRATRIE